MNQQVYIKKGRKYHKIGYSDGWYGFPTEGIWAVYSKPGIKSTTCIAKVGEFKSIDYSMLASLIEKKEEECSKIITTFLDKGGKTQQDLIRSIFETLLKEDEDKT